MFCLSIVTWNRREVLERTLKALWRTTEPEAEAEGVKVFVTDNGSTDGTAEMLREMEAAGENVKAYCLSENLGTSGGRNAHWRECCEYDAVRMDDKVEFLAAGWLTAMRAQAERHHCIVGPPYDPSVTYLYRLAPPVSFVRWEYAQGVGGPVLFFPAEVNRQLGAIDELEDEQTGEMCKYGYDDCLQIERAGLLGWGFGFSLRLPVKFTAGASPARRASAERWIPAYLERKRQYVEAERDLFLPFEDMGGYIAGQVARAEVVL